ncbi:hypothetical protein KC360_g180 [Hortaea werneckii]|nr:hypothetical protein KC344_g185 [Hortaea werneckii]KAI7180470.1 hypothetical protein KC360_g180 [Hortaea werneckii]
MVWMVERIKQALARIRKKRKGPYRTWRLRLRICIGINSRTIIIHPHSSRMRIKRAPYYGLLCATSFPNSTISSSVCTKVGRVTASGHHSPAHDLDPVDPVPIRSRLLLALSPSLVHARAKSGATSTAIHSERNPNTTMTMKPRYPVTVKRRVSKRAGAALLANLRRSSAYGIGLRCLELRP